MYMQNYFQIGQRVSEKSEFFKVFPLWLRSLALYGILLATSVENQPKNTPINVNAVYLKI